jgi:hypothetical protein
MSGTSPAWDVVQIAELVRAGEERLLRALRTLNVDARVTMPEQSGWVLSGEEAEELRTVLIEHSETAEQLRALAERLPEQGVAATYVDVRDGAAAALSDGILDPAAVAMAAAVLDVRVGWRALADSLASTDVRSAWTTRGVADLLGAFRGADRRLVQSALREADIAPEERWPDLSATSTRRLAAALSTRAEQA